MFRRLGIISEFSGDFERIEKTLIKQ